MVENIPFGDTKIGPAGTYLGTQITTSGPISPHFRLDLKIAVRGANFLEVLNLFLKVNGPLLHNHAAISGQLLQHDVGGRLQNGVGLWGHVAPILAKIRFQSREATPCKLKAHVSLACSCRNECMPAKKTQDCSKYPCGKVT